ncbi:MAG: L-aspartate oxidase [Clostridia bacterium]|nr:L-aspartate oxidase [Lachnospiraceae bacterium]NCC02039.1 L-aspartate oxidase [Clostridia bacterium]NCD04024.1 L-aspartate oxidase [Clostridia bacterium]
MKKIYDVIIVGCGVAGCFTALHLPEEMNILMISKAELDESDSFLAQGGICVLKDEKDYDSFFEDTLRAGHYENRRESVDIMIRSSREIIDELVNYGVDFAREGEELLYTREGAHSTNRILYHDDITGKEITSTLLKRVREKRNVTLVEHTEMLDILAKDNQCDGILLKTAEGELRPVFAQNVVWACGGIGGIYDHSTNFPHLTGDALAISLKRGIELEHVNYVQIHPTTLYTCHPGRSFLISESVRGEGAVLYNKQGERFVNELLPRDVVTKAIRKQMAKDHMPYVRLSFQTIKDMDVRERFPNIYKRCLEEGYDITKEPIPVVPAQHYFMGGVWVDANSQTSMKYLYAAGETSCNGVHGANRLASNSLLESLVFAKRAALKMSGDSTRGRNCLRASLEFSKLCQLYNIDMDEYKNEDAYRKKCKESIWKEIRRESVNESDNNQIKCG